MMFARLLRPFITVGTLRIVDASGHVHTLEGGEPGPEVGDAVPPVRDYIEPWKDAHRAIQPAPA
jgi:hypothetical protein